MKQKNLYLCVISAPSSEARDQVAKHLRYWPHVKFYKYQGARHLLCCFCLGEAKDGYQLKQLYERSRLLVLLCLRQYDVTITRWKPLPDDFKLHHDRPVVIRPDETLKPLIIYMGDSVSGCAKAIPHGRPEGLKISQKSDRKSQFFQMMSLDFIGRILKTQLIRVRKRISEKLTDN